jgi:tetratricopeptide (TPR) repeat protein
VGILQFWLDWDWAAAEKSLRKAIQFDPTYSLAHRMLGIVLAHQRDDAEARKAMEKARALDPLNAMHHALSAQVAFVTRDFSAALEYARQATITLENFWIGHYQMAQAYEQLGEYELALQALKKAGEIAGANSKVIGLRGYILAKLGTADEAQAILGTIRSLSQERYIPAYTEALIYAGLGDSDQVYRQLQRALKEHDVHLALLPADPKWDSMRSATQFSVVLEDAGLPNPLKTTLSK